MASRIAQLLAATFALNASIGVGTEPGAAGGFGGFGGGPRFGGFSGARGFGGGPHFSGFGSAHGFGGHGYFGPARMGPSHITGANVGHFNGHTWTSHGAWGAAGSLGGHAAWNHWGNPYWKTGWNGGWGGWVGPVFWPYFYGDLLAFVLWPYGYDYPFWFDPFWAYGDIFLWDAIFWPGPYPYPDYAYAPDVYGVYGPYGYEDGSYGYYDHPPHRRVARVPKESPENTGSTSNGSDSAQTCGGMAPGVTDLPVDRLKKAIHLSDEQITALEALKAASSQASDVLQSSCSSEVAQTPLGRLDAVQKRIDGMTQALAIVRTPLDSFYNSLNEEQRQRLATLVPASGVKTNRRGSSASGSDLANLCSHRAEGFTQLPVQRIEQSIKPTQQQQDAFEKLKAASSEAANQLQASCPSESPQAAMDRFDAVGKRLNAMAAAIKTVRPALASFYASLTDEQKARFNTLGPPKKTTASRQG
jgi:LTXXQ motif family protein